MHYYVSNFGRLCVFFVMAIGDVQFNASTLKVSFNTTTDKVQMVSGYAEGCDDCDPNTTPYQITVTFSSVGDPFGCKWIGPHASKCYINLSGDWESAVNDTWTLTQTGDPCVWDENFASALPVDWYATVTPPNYCDTYRFTEDSELWIEVDISAGTIKAWFWLYTDGSGDGDVPCGGDGSWLQFFDGTLSPDEGYCLKESGITNDLAGGSGTATIVEL